MNVQLFSYYYCIKAWYYCKGKGKLHPRTGHEGAEEEWMYSSTLPSTSALDGMGDQRHAPAALPLERLSSLCIGG